MVTVKDFSVDTPAYFLERKSCFNFADQPEEVRVVKVGRKFVTVKSGYREYKFEVPEYDKRASYLVESALYGWPSILFPTMQSFHEWKEREDLLEWFKQHKDKFGCFETNRLRAAKMALEGGERMLLRSRKILCYKGTKDVWTFFISGQRNPCGCGSNCYHEEYDGEKVIGVCNACNQDIYEMKPECAKDELKRETWIDKEEI